jgi:hypothetical protein
VLALGALDHPSRSRFISDGALRAPSCERSRWGEILSWSLLGILLVVAVLAIVDGSRHCQLLDEGDIAGAETWHRILNAIEQLKMH